MADINHELLDLDSIVAKLDTIEDPDAAAAALAAKRIEEEPIIGAGEVPPTEVVEDDGKREPALPAIEPPTSWKSEAKEQFAQLPRHLQEVVAERERERESYLGRQSNEIAETRKAVDAERARMTEDRQKALQNFYVALNSVISSDPIIAEGRAIDWPRLASQDAATYAAKKAIFDDRVQRLSNVIQQREQYAQQMAMEQQRAHQENLTKQRTLLLDKVQEWRDDPEKASTAIRDVVSHAHKRYGITEQEIHQVGDHRAILMLRDNMVLTKRLEEAEAKLSKMTVSKEATLKEIEGKKASTPAPKVMAPRAASETKETSDRTKALVNQARKSGKDNDRLDAVMAALSGAR